MNLSWFALPAALAGGLLLASPASASSPTYTQCIDGCNRAGLSGDDRATCKLQCDHDEKARARQQQANGQPVSPHSSSPTGAPHVTGAPATPPAQSPEHVAALCRAQCSSEAPADRMTCELNCKASAAPRPAPPSATVHNGAVYNPNNGQTAVPSTTYPNSYPSTGASTHWPSGPTHGAPPTYGATRPQETAAQQQERLQCEANCSRPGVSNTDLETCKLNCDAVGWVQSQPLQRRIISDRPLTQAELDAMRRQAIQNSPGSAGTTYPNQYPSAASSTYVYRQPGAGPSTTTRKTTDPAVLQRCASAWYTCDSGCSTPEASCLDSCNAIRSSTDQATCKLNCTNVRDSCKDRCNSARTSCESVPIR